MSDTHAAERKRAVTVRLTESQLARLRRLARANDRSINQTVVRIIRAELDSVDAREIAR